MTTYLINHLRIPGGIPKPENLEYLEQVEATFTLYGGKWLVLDAEVESFEGAWPGSAVLMSFPNMEAAKRWYHSDEYQEILHLRTDNTILEQNALIVNTGDKLILFDTGLGNLHLFGPTTGRLQSSLKAAVP